MITSFLWQLMISFMPACSRHRLICLHSQLLMKNKFLRKHNSRAPVLLLSKQSRNPTQRLLSLKILKQPKSTSFPPGDGGDGTWPCHSGLGGGGVSSTVGYP